MDEKARGQGMGEALTRAGIELAREKGARGVELTSRPAREAANRLYQRIGIQAEGDEFVPVGVWGRKAHRRLGAWALRGRGARDFPLRSNEFIRFLRERLKSLCCKVPTPANEIAATEITKPAFAGCRYSPRGVGRLRAFVVTDFRAGFDHRNRVTEVVTTKNHCYPKRLSATSPSAFLLPNIRILLESRALA